MNENKLNNKGFTLVEMVVSFALLGIFMVAATKVIYNTTEVYYQAKGIQTAIQVSDIISSKITEELEGALVEGFFMGDRNSIWISDNGNEIRLINSSGERIIIRNYWLHDNKGYMCIFHAPLEYKGENNNNLEYSEWSFDDKVYMGYKIKNLTFTKIADMPEDSDYGKFDGNIIRLDLTITSNKYGDYSTATYIKCYNFKDATDWERIKVY